MLNKLYKFITDNILIFVIIALTNMCISYAYPNIVSVVVALLLIILGIFILVGSAYAK